MWGGDGGRIYGESHDDSAWVGGRGATELENPGHRGRFAYISNGLPGQGCPWSCPVEGFPGQVSMRTAMRVHFLHRNILDTVVILEEVNLPHPRHTRCEMMVPRRALNGRQPATAQCTRGSERKRRQLAEAELRESTERAFDAYGELLDNLMAFRYLGWVLTVVDDDWLEVVGNIRKSRKSWGRLLRILSREGADPEGSGHFYKAVVQEVLMFGAET